MDNQIIVITPSQLTTLVMEAVTQALQKHHQSLAETQSDPDRWMTVEELSDYLPGKPAKTTLYEKARRRELPSKRMGKRLVFLKSEIDQFLQGKHLKTYSEIVTLAERYLSAN